MELTAPKPEIVFDPEVRMARLNALRNSFGLPPATDQTLDPDAASKPSIGIEIEITWDQTFNSMRDRWLGAPVRPLQYSKQSPTRKEWAKQYNQNDRVLRPVLQAITPVIPRVGFDAYWEFSFDPTKDIAVTAAELELLYEPGIRYKNRPPLETGLLHEGIPYATHMTIAGIDNDRDAFTILCALEQAGGSSPERIDAAITSDKGSWARKGSGGLLKRDPKELQGDDTAAYEFRTLICTSAQQMTDLLHLGQDLAYTCQTNPDEWRDIQRTVEARLKEANLPLTPWEKPRENVDVWRKYGREVLNAAVR